MEEQKFHKELIQLYRAHKQCNFAEFSKYGLTSGQPKVLAVLLEEEGKLQKHLAKRCGVEPATMTVLLNGLEKKEFIKRVAVIESGKRAYEVYLTERGREVAEEVSRVVEETEAKSFVGINEKEKEEFLRVMRKITKNLTPLAIVLATAIVLNGCGNEAVTQTTEAPRTTEAVTTEVVTEATTEETLETTMEVTTEATTEETTLDPIESAKQEEAKDIFIDSLPYKYMLAADKQYQGTIEKITYSTTPYFEEGAEEETVIEKSAYVYLPVGYSEDKEYNVLYLMHGIGGNEKEWGMIDDESRVKKIMDNLTANGEIEPFIIVTPNGRASKAYADTNSDYNSFYSFGKELRNDLIPYMDSHYSTNATREGRAMAGLSMGGMQTINIGMCECLDLIGWFGTFSAAPTSYEDYKIASIIEETPEYPIYYMYNICGTDDNIAYWSSSAAAKNLADKTDMLTDGENFTWFEKEGGHDFNIWYLGFYHFAQIAFQERN